MYKYAWLCGGRCVTELIFHLAEETSVMLTYSLTNICVFCFVFKDQRLVYGDCSQ